MSGTGGPLTHAAGGQPPSVDDSELLLDIVRAVLSRAGNTGWTVESGEFWCLLTPPRWRMRDQGWKLHVSATQLAAPLVLARVAEVVVRTGSAVKFARGLSQLGELLSNQSNRSQGGKFVTVYPADDEQFRRLAAELDRVTDGLPGPVILSDRPVRPGSLVHYRYGVFGAEPVLGNDGVFRSMLTGPDGRQVPDERQAWFSPPPWAEAPLPGHESEPAPEPAPEPDSGPAPVPRPAARSEPAAELAAVLVGDRFVVRSGVRHSYRGGVFRATDQWTGADVILKQARPHVLGALTGADARDWLRHEAEVLDQLAPLGLAPRKVALVTHQENLFLAEETVPGVTLRQWVADRVVDAWRGRGAPLAATVDFAGQLVRIIGAVHAQGLVLRDFTPGNLMVTPAGELRLIDLEFAVPAGTQVPAAYTPGYAGPELAAAPPFGAAPTQQADLYSLGATILYLVSGLDPVLPADEPVNRPGQERLAELLARAGADLPAVRRLSLLVLGLMHDDPDQRWSLARARDFLAAAAGAADPGPERAAGELTGGGGSASGLPAVAAERLLTDGLSHVLATMTPQSPWLWGAADTNTDPCNVQHGAAGVLGVLTRAAGVLGGEQLRDGVAAAAGWVGERLTDVPRVLPGLYFGRSGTAWALHDAARLLGDDVLAARAVELAKQVPVRWPNPDICHGAAGAGMALLHLWASTGDAELRERAIHAADGVLEAAVERNGRLVWPIPADFDSTLAGLVHYGFAHGVAGVGAFLLYAGLATGRADYLDAARRAGDTLHAVADLDADGELAWWPGGESDQDGGASRLRHWCSGSSGVGTFLIRLWAATGELRFRDLAEAAAAAVHRDRWYAPIVACHGLAGDGDFLLDVADLTGQPRYRAWAADLAAVMYARHAIRNGRLVLPAGSATRRAGAPITAGYGTGLSGALGFLLRLRHVGPRWWMPDEILASALPASWPPSGRRQP
jgi:tRNA A-37 threonylcarbamoyl transferase component Bud32